MGVLLTYDGVKAKKKSVRCRNPWPEKMFTRPEHQQLLPPRCHFMRLCPPRSVFCAYYVFSAGLDASQRKAATGNGCSIRPHERGKLTVLVQEHCLIYVTTPKVRIGNSCEKL